MLSQQNILLADGAAVKVRQFNNLKAENTVYHSRGKRQNKYIHLQHGIQFTNDAEEKMERNILLCNGVGRLKHLIPKNVPQLKGHQ